MAAFRLALLLGAVTASAVTPVEKVITLLEDLKSQVEGEGKEEAATYDKFACFCKDKTKDKSGAIVSGNDEIDQLSADIASNTALKSEKSTELMERKKKQEEHESDLEAEVQRCQKEEAEFEAQVADLSKAVSSLSKALTALKDSKPSSFLQMKDLVHDSLALADALSLIPSPKKSKVQAFLQVDPEDPAYKFQSQGIIDTIDQLHKDFDKKLTEVTDEKKKAKELCDDQKSALTTLIEENNEAMDTLKEDIDGLEKTISDDRGDLVAAEGTLKDDQQYLKELTKKCETSAKDWDQRSSMRAGELEALSGALEVLTKEGGVKDLDEVNERAFIQKKAAAEAPKKAVSFIQESAAAQVLARAHNLRGNTRAMMAVAIQASSWGSAQYTNKAAQTLQQAGIKLKSEMLTSVAAKVMADPFQKVKKLIQELIERLLNEATQEATKKGFCDEELGKATTTRDQEFAEIKKLTAELTQLEVKKETLNNTIVTLKDDIEGLEEALKTTTDNRKDEKEDNMASIKTAKEGVKAVSEAITILKVFYKNAAKASFVQASPVDEDTEGAGFSGSYKGNQAGGGGIIGMLEVIKSDFERTVRKTTQEEEQALADFVEFDRTSKMDIKGKETTVELSEQDLKSTESAIDMKTGDLTTAQGLLDDALKSVENLKPMCIDTGMSYADRVAKREEEIAALKTALCQLDPEGVESECQ
jgi:chromosome segregation ATPase